MKPTKCNRQFKNSFRKVKHLFLIVFLSIFSFDANADYSILESDIQTANSQLTVKLNDSKYLVPGLKELNYNLSALNTLQTITIDGALNESSWNISNTLSKQVIGSSNNISSFGAIWNANYLYIGVKVMDSNLHSNLVYEWDGDAIELFFDGNLNGDTIYEEGYDFQIIKPIGQTDLSIFLDAINYNGTITGIISGYSVISGGYTMEFAIPWFLLGISPESGTIFGFDIANDDDDDANGRSSQIGWNTTFPDNWTDLSYLGQITLQELKILEVSTGNLTIASLAGSSSTFDITSNVNWTASSNQSWLDLNNTSGSGNKTIVLTAEANPTTTTRTATVTISGTGVATKMVEVSQGINTSLCIDQYESNDSRLNANTSAFNPLGNSSSVQSIYPTIYGDADIDYFRLNVENTGTLKITLIPPFIDETYANYDLKLFENGGSLIGISENSHNILPDDIITYKISTTGNYYVNVYKKNLPWCQPYSLEVEWTPDLMPVLESIEIFGSTEIFEQSNENFFCIGYWSNGTSQILSSTTTWTENSNYASISDNGVLTATSIASDQTCIITAEYGGKSTTHSVLILHLESAPITDVEGNSYSIVQIGNQWWMTKNLKTTKYNDGISIPYVSDNFAWSNLSTPAYCWYDNNESVNKNKYGAIYNWYTVNTGKLCPTNWHVPTHEEWNVLENFIADSNEAGNKLKAATGWNSGGNGTDEVGFTGLPGGDRYGIDGSYSALGNNATWWSSTEDGASAWERYLNYSNSIIGRDKDIKKDGFSVRCIKDETSIIKTDQIITFNTLPEKIYGDEDFNPGATNSSELPILFESVNIQVASIINNKIHITGAGTSIILASQQGNDNYNTANDVIQILIVKKAELKVVADDKYRIYGQQNPVFTLSYDGFKNGENASVLDIIPLSFCNALPESPIGNYTISVLDGADNNYSFKYINGLLSIKESTAIDDINLKDLSVFPNPVNDKISIRFNLNIFDPIKLELLDINGRILLSKTVMVISENNLETLDLSSFINGMYNLRIITKNNVVTERLIKL